MGDDRTIAIQIKDGFTNTTTRHYNIDNIAFFRSIDVNITPAGWGGIFGPAVLVVGLLTVAGYPLVGLLAGATLAGGVWWWLRTADAAIIGTLTNTTTLATNELATLEQTFKDQSRELISITGHESAPLREYEYRHHLVPDNIVTIQRSPRSVSLKRLAVITAILTILTGLVDPALLAVLAGNVYISEVISPVPLLMWLILTAIIVGVANTLPAGGFGWVPLDDPTSRAFVSYSIVAFAVFLPFSLLVSFVQPSLILRLGMTVLNPITPFGLLALVLRTAIVGGGLVALLSVPGDAVTIQLQGGHRQQFRMDSRDVEAVLNQFAARSDESQRDRTQARSTVETESTQPAEDASNTDTAATDTSDPVRPQSDSGGPAHKDARPPSEASGAEAARSAGGSGTDPASGQGDAASSSGASWWSAVERLPVPSFVVTLGYAVVGTALLVPSLGWVVQFRLGGGFIFGVIGTLGGVLVLGGAALRTTGNWMSLARAVGVFGTLLGLVGIAAPFLV